MQGLVLSSGDKVLEKDAENFLTEVECNGEGRHKTDDHKWMIANNGDN